MYSQLQPWATAGAPPCLEPVSGPQIAPRIGTYYQTPRPHPWRPTLGYELIEVTPLPAQSLTNAYQNPCFSPAGMSTEPLRFPNLVTGFERNPQHAARAALYTRYTGAEWQNAVATTYAESDSNRGASEKLRARVVSLLRQTDEKSAGGQLDSGFRIGERITDVTFWRNELNTELEKLVAETQLLASIKRNIAKAEQDLEVPLHIAQECLYHRESRGGFEKAHDIVEKALLIEIDNLRTSQKKFGGLYEQISRQLSDCRAAQYALEEDVTHKEAAIGIDSVCHQLNNFSRGINYYGGIEKVDSSVATGKQWMEASAFRVTKSQSEREKSTQFRTDVDKLINGIATSVWDCWSATNNALAKRATEMEEAKCRVQLHLQRIQQELFGVEKHLDLLRKAIDDKALPLKVAQTRLESRGHRSGLEMCKDSAQLRLVQEVEELQAAMTDLYYALQETEAQHQQLLKTRSNLETELKNKVNALFIDREKCMGLRRSFPVNNLIKY